MKKVICYIVILTLIILGGCHKKKYPKPAAANETIFYSKLLVDGQPVEINTGKDGYYMYSSYTLDSSSVYNLVGELRQTGCSSCANSLRIQINDSKISWRPDSLSPGSALQVKNYEFLSGFKDMEYIMNFTGSFNKNASSILWDFGDGITSTFINPPHNFKSGKHKVSLTITGQNQCQSTMATTISATSPNDLNAYVSASTTSNTIFFTPHVTGGKAPYTFLWSFGDDSTSTQENVHHTYFIKGGHNVKLKVSDANGNTSTCYYNAIAEPDPSACATNIAFSALSKPTRLGLSKTSIQYTDANGITYTSDNALQPAGSSFEILSVEEFVRNENNQPVKKVKLKFNCTLYHGTQSISLQGTEVVVGFAYKE